MTIATKLVNEFAHIVSRDGGVLTLLSDEPELIRVGYRMGRAPECASGACILPHLELQDLMSETLRRRDPTRRIAVELIK